MSLSGPRILIVGGGSGIGRAIAERAVAEAARVVIASTNAERLVRTVAELGDQVTSAVIDVGSEPSVENFFSRAGSFDHIAFTAGDWVMQPPGPLSELDLAAAARALDVRFWGAVAVAKHGASHLPAGGSFTVTGGMLAHLPSKGRPLWTALAGSIEFLARGLAADLAPIRVNAVCPGLIQTEQWDSFPEAYKAQLLEAAQTRQLLPRPGRPAECAEAYLYLMRNAFVTGQVVYVEGGAALAS